MSRLLKAFIEEVMLNEDLEGEVEGFNKFRPTVVITLHRGRQRVRREVAIMEFDLIKMSVSEFTRTILRGMNELFEEEKVNDYNRD